MRKTKAESEKEIVDYILSVGGAIKNIEMDEGNSSYHQFELANGETRYWENMSIENLRRLGFCLESEGG